MSATAPIVILIARITPGLSYLIPLFILFQWSGCSARGASDHHPLVVTVPIVIWIMIGYFETTPVELEKRPDRRRDALAGFRHVALPIGAPASRSRDPGGDLLVEQLRVRHRARRARDAAPCPSRSTT